MLRSSRMVIGLAAWLLLCAVTSAQPTDPLPSWNDGMAKKAILLEYATTGDGARLGMLVLHDDNKREYAYGPATGLPESRVGAFSQALYDEAKKRGWVVISMKDDWKRLFSFDQ